MVGLAIRGHSEAMDSLGPRPDQLIAPPPDASWPNVVATLGEAATVHDGRRPPLSTHRAIAWIALCVPSLMAVIVWLVWSVSSPRVAAGECEGIGFGCVLSPRESVGLVGVVLGVPVSIVLVVLGALVAWMVPERGKRGVVVGLLSMVPVAWGTFMMIVAGL